MEHNLLQWNCNGFYSHIEEVKLLINSHNPIALCIQETRFQSLHIPKCSGYIPYFKHCDSNLNASGGVAIFLRNDIHGEEIPLNSNLQVVAVQMKYPKMITICNLYIPPDLQVNQASLTTLIDQLPKPFILVGDFNAHNPIWGSQTLNSKGRVIEDVLQNSNVYLLNNGMNTRFNKFNGTFSAIDLSFTSPSLALQIDWQVNTDLCNSDHFPIFLRFANYKQNNTRRPKFLLNHADWSNFNKELIVNELDVSCNTIDDVVDEFTQNIFNASKKSIPLTSHQVPKRVVPWWSEEIKEAIHKRKKLLKLFRNRPSSYNLNEFKKAEAKSKYLIKTAKRNSWQSFVSSINEDTPIRECWNKIRKISGTYKSNNVNSLISGNVLHTDPNSICNILGKNIELISHSSSYTLDFQRTKIDKERTELDFHESVCSEYNSPITNLELNNALKKGAGTSPGHDLVSYEMIRNLNSDSHTYLLDIFNKIWNDDCFPKAWKLALVVPVLKPGKPMTDASSYRAISLTSCLCKVLERIVSNRLLWFLNTNNHLNYNQNGFRRGCSTMDNLVTLEHKILNAFAKKERVIAIFFDIKEAYNKIWQYGVLMSMHKMGIRGNLANYIKNFMSNRKFKVMLGNVSSEVFNQDNGVPQGSILSVYLFLIGINNLLNCIIHPAEGYLFADDLVVLVQGKKIKQMETILNKTLKEIEKWSNSCGLTFSINKMSCITFSRLRKPAPDPILSLHNSRIPIADQHKFLGVIFDKRLSFVPHITSLHRQCIQRVNILKVLSNRDWGASRHALLTVYKSLIRSKIEYASIIYSSANSSILVKLDKLQNNAIRIATGAFKSSPIVSILIESSVPSLETRRHNHIIKFVVKLAHKPNHPLFNALYNNSDILHHLRRFKNPSKSFILRAVHILNKYNISIPRFTVFSTLNQPWKQFNINVITDLQIHKRSDTSNIIYKQIYKELLKSHPNYIFIYTDGSKLDSKAGCAIYYNNKSSLFGLPDEFSVFSAELFAISKAVDVISNQTEKGFLIFSDCLSAIQAIKYPSQSNNYLVHEIRNKIIHIQSDPNKCIKLCWIPSHISILENEIVDQAAKEATLLTSNANIPSDDFVNHFNDLVKSEQDLLWQNTLNNKLRLCKPSTCKFKEFSSLSKREQIILTRLRIGHTHLTHSFLMTRDDPPQCQTCNCQLSIHHILLHCTEYTQQRTISGLSNEFETILSDDIIEIRKLFTFLELINIKDKI